MSNNSNSLVSLLITANLLNSSSSKKLTEFLALPEQENELPLHLLIFLGIGALISSVCLVTVLSILNIIDHDSPKKLLLLGILFVTTVLFLAKTLKNTNSVIKYSFYTQFSFCIMCVGKFLFIIGLKEIIWETSDWGVPLSALIITIITYNIYSISIDQFLSSVATLALLFLIIAKTEYKNGEVKEVIMNLFIFIQVIIAGFLFMHNKVKYKYIPLAYALILAICTEIIVFSTSSGKLIYKGYYSFTSLNIVLTISLIILLGLIVRDFKKLMTEPFILSLIGIILLGFLSASGIILAISLIMLGYSKDRKLLTYAGILLMPIYIFVYYYNLNITLMEKSIALICPGLVLLVIPIYLKKRNFINS